MRCCAQPDGQITESVSSPSSKNIPLNTSGKSGVYREPADFPGGSHYDRPIFRANRDLEAQRRLQKKLRQADRRISLSAIHQRRAWPFARLDRLVSDDRDNCRGLAEAARLALVVRSKGSPR